MKTQRPIGGDSPPNGFQAWRQRVGGFSGLPAFLRALNLDPSLVLASAGLERDALDAPEARIGYAALGRLLQASAERAAYPHLGLTAGRMWHLEDLGTLGEAVRHSATVGEAVQTLVLHQHLHSEGGLAFSARHGSLVEVGYAIYYPGITGANQIYDFAIAWIFNFLRELCGTGWLPSQVLIPHAKPHEPVHYRNLFKIVPQFDSEVCAIRFPALWLDRRMEGADPERRRQALAAIDERDGPDMLQQVFRALRDLLMTGRSSGNDVAYALSMHRRTLNRRLQQCGTTFQCVLDEVRCEVARQLLCYSELALDDIAASLGYAGVSPFMRSFRRWTGLSPGRLRRLALEGQYDKNLVMVDAGHERVDRSRPPAVPERAPHAGQSSWRVWRPGLGKTPSSEASARLPQWPAQRGISHTFG